MDYNVIMTPEAEKDLDAFIRYLIFDKKSEQAAANVIDDFEQTKQSLTKIAGSLKLCDNQKLKELGYRRINFFSHRYFLLYRIQGNNAIIDNIFHELQDFENKMI